jgi:hypothetical protein
MKKIILIIYIACCLSCSSKAQNIVYDFPESVIQKIDKHISFYPDTTKFAILFSALDSGKYRISILQDLWGLQDINQTLVQKTSRFVRVNKALVPLITWEDITFADFGTVYTPESKSEKRRVGKKKIVFTDDSPGIIFDKSGKIY